MKNNDNPKGIKREKLKKEMITVRLILVTGFKQDIEVEEDGILQQ